MVTEKKKGTPTVKSYSILIAPIITEKTSLIGASGSTIVFRVDRRATKTEIRSAVERAFKVDVDAVRTANIMGKPKRTAKSAGRRAAYKKAYVTLKDGQTINIVEGV